MRKNFRKGIKMGEQGHAGLAPGGFSGKLTAAFTFYRDGFRAMVLGRTLWKIILIKLIIMFGVLKLFFFPDFLNTTYTTEAEKAAHVLNEITTPAYLDRPGVINQTTPVPPKM